MILYLFVFDMSLDQAVNVLRFHHQLPQHTLIRHDQRDVPVTTREELEKLGYTVEANSWGDLGDVQAITIEGQQVTAAADSRGRGVARTLEIPASVTAN